MDYLSQEHTELGRKGNICPYVPQALRADTIIMETFDFQAETDDLATLCGLMRRQIERFPTLPFNTDRTALETLVTVLTGLPEHQGILLDEAQRRLKAYAVKRGLMLGQFHPQCATPAALNPMFQVSRSPEPLFAIRRMALHDILFLHASPELFAEYQQRFGAHYERKTPAVPDVYSRLYEQAARRSNHLGAYVNYQSLDVLHSLQHPHTDHPAEMAFYLSGQAKELLFKLICEQARAIRLELAADHIDEAVWGLRRLSAGLEVLTQMWNLLRTLAPTEFNAFREQLGGASGIDSYMFRIAEFTLGRKSAALANRYAERPGIAEAVYQALHETSVYDETLLLLCRTGLLPRQALQAGQRDSEAVTQAWAKIYREQGPSGAQFRLAEALMDVDENFSRWRALHLLMVERMIGSLPGTGGTDGISWLQRTTGHRFFPELWAARVLLFTDSTRLN